MHSVLFLVPIALLSEWSRFSSGSLLRGFSSTVGKLKSPVDVAIELANRTCDKSEKTVVVCDEPNAREPGAFHHDECASIVAIGRTRRREDEKYALGLSSKLDYEYDGIAGLQRAAGTFVVTAPSSAALLLRLDGLKNSLWWNSAGKFLLLRDGSAGNDCRHAGEYLRVVWSKGLLSSLFLCAEKDDGADRAMIYSFNPFRNYSPDAWTSVAEYESLNGRPFYLLALEYSSERVVAHDTLFFDKTLNLYGCPIRTKALNFPPSVLISPDDTGKKAYGGLDAVMMENLILGMNATLVDITEENELDYGFMAENGSYFGIVSDVFEGRIDIGTNTRFMDWYWKVPITNPFKWAGVCFATKKRGNAPQWSKVLKAFNLPMVAGLVLVLVVKWFTLGYSTQRDVVGALLNLERILLCTSSMNLPTATPARLSYGSLLLFFVVIGTAFGGRLVSLLTTPLEYSQVKDWRDLEKSGYVILGGAGAAEAMKSLTLRNRFRTENGECFDELLTGEPVACLGDCIYLKLRSLEESKIFVSEQMTNMYYVYITAVDWPLLKRANGLIRRMFEMGLTEIWGRIVWCDAERKRWKAMRAASPRPLKVLAMADLAFIFYVLIFGLTCATMAFLWEARDSLTARRRRGPIHPLDEWYETARSPPGRRVFRGLARV